MSMKRNVLFLKRRNKHAWYPAWKGHSYAQVTFFSQYISPWPHDIVTYNLYSCLCYFLCLTYSVHYSYWRPFLWTLRFMPRRSAGRRTWFLGVLSAVIGSAPVVPEPQFLGTTFVYIFGHGSTRPFLCICVLCLEARRQICTVAIVLQIVPVAV